MRLATILRKALADDLEGLSVRQCSDGIIELETRLIKAGGLTGLDQACLMRLHRHRIACAVMQLSTFVEEEAEDRERLRR